MKHDDRRTARSGARRLGHPRGAGGSHGSAGSGCTDVLACTDGVSGSSGVFGADVSERPAGVRPQRRHRSGHP
ncbi:hypothetical protein [Corynebacterium xerosis]|uniref:Uncharacterized protein n=1 Tax=Corynebacterium xerosis TaxID=1725 RepID=A0ABV3UWC8_9CORY|nr:hypothetical protein [Corynebacterium xerosis]